MPKMLDIILFMKMQRSELISLSARVKARGWKFGTIEVKGLFVTVHGGKITKIFSEEIEDFFGHELKAKMSVDIIG
mgnify:FL=1